MSQGKNVATIPQSADPKGAAGAPAPLEEAALSGGLVPPATVYRSDYAAKPISPAAVFRPESLTELLRTPIGRIAAVSTGAALVLGSLLGALALGPLFAGVTGARAGARSGPVVATRTEILPPPSCLRESSQTIKSDARDALLLDAVKAQDAGRSEQALELLRKYTAEACDRATLEAVDALERQLTTGKKEP